MEERDKKRRTGQDAAFYTALAVCLIAVGVGAWQLLQPEKAPSGTAAVSSSSALPETIGPEAPEGVGESGEGAETPQAVSGAAALPDTQAAPNASDAQASASSDTAQAVSGGKGAESGKSDAGSAETDGAQSSKDADGAKGAETGGAKSSKDTGSTKGADAAKSADTGSTKSSKSSNKGATGAKDADSAKGSKETGEAKSGTTARPVEGAVVTGYSMDRLLYNETMRDWRTHDGIDIAAEAGAAVVAAKAGTVESVTADPIMGVTVTIRHDGAWETVYSSLTDAPEAEAGDEVAAGQVIGFVGETAASESALGPHLHFAALKDGAPSDPEAFLS